MNPTHFEIRGLHAQVDGSRVVLLSGDDHVATVTFRPSGIFTLVERGSGNAGRLPDSLGHDLERATEYVLNHCWPSQTRLAA